MDTYCKWSWLPVILLLLWRSSLLVAVQAEGGWALNSLYLSPWRRHEGNLPAHQQAVQRRPGGLRVPLHPLHRLPLSAGGGRRRRQKHQHMLQLENGQSSAGGKSWTCRYNQAAPKEADRTEKAGFVGVSIQGYQGWNRNNKKHKCCQKAA